MKLFKKLSLAAALAVYSLLPAGDVYAKDAQKNEAKQKTAPMTLEEQIQNIEEAKVEIRHRNSEKAFFGSGCVYMKKDGYYYILTNNHVVEGASNLMIVDDRNDVYAEDDIPLEIIVSSKKKDAAIVRAKEADVLKHNKIKDEYNASEKIKKKKIDVFKGELGNSDEVKVLDEIIVAGYPIAMSGITRGWVLSVTYYELSQELMTDHECFLISTPISPGNSGSAAYLLKNNKLYLIGLVHAGFSGERTQNMNLAIKLNEFKGMLFDFKNPDDPTEEEIKKIAERSEKGSQLENLFAISSGHGYLTLGANGQTSIYLPKKNILLATSQDGGFKLIIFNASFPDNLADRIELIDKKENGFGQLDLIIAKDKENTELKDTATMPSWLQYAFQSAYKSLAKNIVNYIEYKKLLNKEGKLSLADTEKLKKYELRIQMLNKESLAKLDYMESKWNQYLAQEKQKKQDEKKPEEKKDADKK